MAENFKIYKFYKGEKEAPENLTVEQGRLYDAEKTFNEDFQKNDSAEWFAFFKDCEKDGVNAGKLFMEKLGEDEEEKPAETSKKWVFGLWLDFYLFVEKFPAAWREIYDKCL